MLQNWYRISFLHWPCNPAPLQARLPVGLEIDTFDQTGWVGLTPFHLMGLRPPFLPAMPCVSNFPEMNLRTYVRGPSGPGIWFFSLDAAAVAAVLGARLTYGLPYYWSRMTVRTTGRSRIHYTSARAGVAADITVDVGEALARPNDLVLFLTDRYRLYTCFLGRLVMAPVEHGPWPLHRAAIVGFQETVRQAANLPARDAPALVHYSPGIHVRIGAPRPARRAMTQAPHLVEGNLPSWQVDPGRPVPRSVGSTALRPCQFCDGDCTGPASSTASGRGVDL
jgi:uncharacterized protein YqjF (DUF2071 family)